MSDQLLAGLSDSQKEPCDNPSCWCNIGGEGHPEWGEEDDLKLDRTGGPTYGIPLQEQVEQVEDALSKALELIEALVTERNERANDVYQAQVDAQDWQNKYNSDVAHARIQELTEENTRLELRLENYEQRNLRQAKRLSRIQATVQGQYDIKDEL